MPRQPPCAPGMSRDRLHCPQNSFQTARTRASMQLKREIGLLCKEDAVLTSTFRRARAGTEVAVTSTRVCGGYGVPHAKSSAVGTRDNLDGFEPCASPEARH